MKEVRFNLSAHIRRERLPEERERSLWAIAFRYIQLIGNGVCPVCVLEGKRTEIVPLKRGRLQHHFAHPCGHHLWSDWGTHHQDPRV